MVVKEEEEVEEEEEELEEANVEDLSNRALFMARKTDAPKALMDQFIASFHREDCKYAW